MKNIILFLLFLAITVISFNEKTFSESNEIVFNEPVTHESMRKLWRKIYALDLVLPKKKEIVIYYDSLGGNPNPAVLFLERIKVVKSKGRVLKGIIYGECASACGSLFAGMTVREMTPNAQYMQHLCRNIYTGQQSQSCVLYDLNRFQYDAKMFDYKTHDFFNRLKHSDLTLTSKEMLKRGAISAIIPIEKVNGI